MTTARDLAAARLATLKAINPHAVDLARYASLAVRVDAALLRRLRLNLLPEADASAEADLWFSELTESRGTDGFVLDDAVCHILREELKRGREQNGASSLDVAYAHMATMHVRWPESLRIEEALTYHALRGQPGDDGEIAARLQPVLKSMAGDSARAIQVARWVVRAMPRLPARARESDAAVALVVAAIARLGAGFGALPASANRAMPADVSWLLTSASLEKRTRLVVETYADAVVFRAPREPRRKTSVYLSSTYQDLQAERDAVRRTISILGHQPIGMENYVTASGTVAELASAHIESCEALVLIVGQRYGGRPDERDRKSVTELEWEIARRAGIPILAYIQDHAPGSVPPILGSGESVRTQLEEFRRRLTEASEPMVGRFTTAEELGQRVLMDLGTLLARGADDEGNASLELPTTRPCVVELTWTAGGKAGTLLAAIELERRVELPRGWRDLHVRTLTGDTYRVGRGAGSNADMIELLRRTSVRIVREDTDDVVGAGFFVAHGRVLTLASLLAHDENENAPRFQSNVQAPRRPSATGPSYSVLLDGGQNSKTTITARDPNSDLALLTLHEPSETAFMPSHSVPLRAEQKCWTVAPQIGPVTVLAGTIVSDHDGSRDDSEAPSVSAHVLSRHEEGVHRGAPLVVEDALAGVVVAAHPRDARQDRVPIEAIGMPVVERFLRWALRPSLEDPDVYVSHSFPTTEESWSRHRSMAQRVMAALGEAKLRRVRMTTDFQTPGHREESQRLIDTADGALRMDWPRDSRPIEHFRRETMAIAFRRWADPSFRCLTLTVGSDPLPLPPPLLDVPSLDAESLADRELARLLRETFDPDDARSRPPYELRTDVEAFVRAITTDDEDVAAGLSAIEQHGLSIARGLVSGWARRAMASVPAPSEAEGPSSATEIPRSEATDAATRLLALCTMLALPSGEILDQLRAVADAEPVERAVCLNTIPVQTAELLIAKAWYPRSPLTSVVIRDAVWPRIPAIGQMAAQVRVAVRAALDCDDDEAAWLVAHSTTPFFVVFATRPVPDAATIAALRRELPGAILLFLTGDEHVDERRARALGLRALPRLRPDQGMPLIAEYKRLLNEVAPRTSDGRRMHDGRVVKAARAPSKSAAARGRPNPAPNTTSAGRTKSKAARADARESSARDEVAELRGRIRLLQKRAVQWLGEAPARRILEYKALEKLDAASAEGLYAKPAQLRKALATLDDLEVRILNLRASGKTPSLASPRRAGASSKSPARAGKAARPAPKKRSARSSPGGTSGARRSRKK